MTEEQKYELFFKHFTDEQLVYSLHQDVDTYKTELEIIRRGWSYWGDPVPDWNQRYITCLKKCIMARKEELAKRNLTALRGLHYVDCTSLTALR